MTPLTIEQLQKATGANTENATKYLPHLQVALNTYNINTPKRVAGFLSQIGHESKGLSTVIENLNYSTEALLKLFRRSRISVEDAQAYGRRRGQRAQQVKLANILYGGPFGEKNLGNTKPDDGSRFIGRGLKQLTGRYNYQSCGAALGIDLVNSPDLLLLPKYAALSAGWFWSTNKLNELADSGDVLAMTRRVNGGTNGLTQREELWEAGLRALT